MTVPEIFQRPDDDDELDLSNITTVSVCKQQNGQWFSIPMKYDIEQIDSVEKLHALLGPGLFDLIGRDDRTRRIVRRQKVQIPGVPWKNWDGDTDPTPIGVNHAPPAQQVSPDTGLMVAMVQLMGQQMNATNQMVLAMMNMQNKNADTHVQSMGQMFTAFGEAQSKLLERVMNHSATGDPQNAFLKGVETAAEMQRGIREVSEPAEPEDATGEMTKLVEAVGKGIDVFQKVKGMAQGEAPQS